MQTAITALSEKSPYLSKAKLRQILHRRSGADNNDVAGHLKAGELAHAKTPGASSWAIENRISTVNCGAFTTEFLEVRKISIFNHQPV